MVQRSSSYPRVNLENILIFIKKLTSRYGEGKISQDEVVELLGVTSNTSSSFGSRTSTAKQYGLITYSGNVVTITQRAINYLHPIHEEDLKELKLKMLQSPKLYQKLLNRFSGQKLPSLGVISNLLTHEYNIKSNVAMFATRLFVESIKYAGAVDKSSGVLQLTMKKGIDQSKTEAGANVSDFVEAEDKALVSMGNDECFEQSISLVPGKKAVLSIPWDYGTDKVAATMEIFNELVKKADFEQK